MSLEAAAEYGCARGGATAQPTDSIAPSLPYRSIGSRTEVMARSRSPKRWKRRGRCALAAPGPPSERPRLSSTRSTWAPRAAKTGPVAQRPEGRSGRGRLRARARPSTCSQGCARGAPQPHKRPKPYKRPTPCAGCHRGEGAQYACENAQARARARSKTINDSEYRLRYASAAVVK